jgi:hypothetical protein
MMPILMLRHSTFMGYQDGIREAALLGKAWGVSREWIVNAVACTAYYHAGASSLYGAEAAIADVLDNWN